MMSHHNNDDDDYLISVYTRYHHLVILHQIHLDQDHHQRRHLPNPKWHHPVSVWCGSGSSMTSTGASQLIADQ